jgi:hypothetical protein
MRLGHRPSNSKENLSAFLRWRRNSKKKRVTKVEQHLFTECDLESESHLPIPLLTLGVVFGEIPEEEFGQLHDSRERPGFETSTCAAWCGTSVWLDDIKGSFERRQMGGNVGAEKKILSDEMIDEKLRVARSRRAHGGEMHFQLRIPMLVSTGQCWTTNENSDRRIDNPSALK